MTCQSPCNLPDNSDTLWGETLFGKPLSAYTDEEVFDLMQTETGTAKKALWEILELRRTIKNLTA